MDFPSFNWFSIERGRIIVRRKSGGILSYFNQNL